MKNFWAVQINPTKYNLNYVASQKDCKNKKFEEHSSKTFVKTFIKKSYCDTKIRRVV